MKSEEAQAHLRLANSDEADELLGKFVTGAITPIEYARAIRDLCPKYEIEF